MSMTPQPVEHDGRQDAASAGDMSPSAARSTKLGVSALVVAVVTIAVFRVAGHLVSLWAPGLLLAGDAVTPSALEWAEAACMAAALLLGLGAVITGRGRLHGAAAVVLAVLGTGFVLQALISVVSVPVAVHDVH